MPVSAVIFTVVGTLCPPVVSTVMWPFVDESETVAPALMSPVATMLLPLVPVPPLVMVTVPAVPLVLRASMLPTILIVARLVVDVVFSVTDVLASMAPLFCMLVAAVSATVFGSVVVPMASTVREPLVAVTVTELEPLI